MISAYIALGVLVLALLSVANAIKIVPQSKAYVVERFGKYRAVLSAGLNVVVPFLDRVAHRVDILERQLAEQPNDVITRDNVMIRVNTAIFFRVQKPEYTVYRIQDISGAIKTAVTGAVRSILGSSDFDEVQSNRAVLNEKLAEQIATVSETWGIELTRCEIIDVTVDEHTRQAMALQLNAERERRALVTKAEGERRAAELRADAELYTAQKRADARRLQAQADAFAIETLAEAINRQGEMAVSFEILKRQVEAVGQVAASSNAKFILLPAELTRSFGDLARVFGSGPSA